jgi:hypothetical protein
MVRMWPDRERLMRSMSVARVVDLPEPVGPVTITRPSCRSQKRSSCGGSPSSSRERKRSSRRRRAMAGRAFSRKTLKR